MNVSRVEAGAGTNPDTHGLLRSALSNSGLDPQAAERFSKAIGGLVDLGRADGTQSALEIEKACVSRALELVRPVLESRLQAELQRRDANVRGGNRCSECRKGTHRSIGVRTREWKTMAGTIRLRRKVLSCSSCGTCIAPSQQQVGLGEDRHTPRLQEVVTLLATTVTHDMAVKLAAELTGVQISEYGVQQLVERRGKAVTERLQAEAREVTPLNAKGLPRRLPRPAGQIPQTVYVEIDGVMPMTRQALPEEEMTAAQKRELEAARRSHARGGKARRYRLVGREVKHAVIYPGDAVARESESRGCVLDKLHVTHLGGPEEFGILLWAEMVRSGWVHAKRIVVISDGSEWIRNLVTKLPWPGELVLILDLFHAKHRIWEVANEAFGEHTTQARAWAEEQCARTETGRSTDVVSALRFLPSRTAKLRELADALIGYLQNNADRMDYPHFREQNLRVGSGVVESGNYHVIGARLKLQGMRWSEAGAREMAYLRADLMNDRWASRTRQLAA